MNLIERIKKIAEADGIPESGLILDGAEDFIKEHGEHPTLEIRMKCSPKNGEIEYIKLGCYSDIYSMTVYEKNDERKVISINSRRRKNS